MELISHRGIPVYLCNSIKYNFDDINTEQMLIDTGCANLNHDSYLWILANITNIIFVNSQPRQI